jgi:ribonucleoside-diphosphate reductase alpha chain
MPDNKGYINTVSVMQKFFDQAISGNWSYNPEHFPDNEVPVSVMAQDLLTTYKYGWKTSYYQNTYDMKTDEYEEPAHSIGWHDEGEVGIQGKTKLDNLMGELENVNEAECESCAI